MNNATNHFRGSDAMPHHLSVGVVLVNDKGQIACHFYGAPTIRRYPPNFYTLVHETIEPGESLEQAAARGLREEFSMKGELVRFVGSLVVPIATRSGVVVEKTVPYLLYRHTETAARDLSDPEAVSDIKWMGIDELITVMKEQGAKYGPSSDESKVLSDVKRFYLKP